MIFNGYNPFSPPKSTPPLPANEIPLAVLKRAREVHATHLSPDGLIAYDQRSNGAWYSQWDNETKKFGCWWLLDGELPGEAVAITNLLEGEKK